MGRNGSGELGRGKLPGKLGCWQGHTRSARDTTTTFGRSTIEPSLAWLLQPVTVQTFLDEIWGTKHHHVKRCCAGYFDSLLQSRRRSSNFWSATGESRRRCA